jgi:hypothetical protein
MDAAPLPSSPHPAKQNKNGNIRKLAIHLENASDLRLAILFSTQPSDGLPAATKIVALKDW